LPVKVVRRLTLVGGRSNRQPESRTEKLRLGKSADSFSHGQRRLGFPNEAVILKIAKEVVVQQPCGVNARGGGLETA